MKQASGWDFFDRIYCISVEERKYRHLELLRRCCGGLERIQKMNEFYHHHKFGIITAHVLILLVLLWSVLP